MQENQSTLVHWTDLKLSKEAVVDMIYSDMIYSDMIYSGLIHTVGADGHWSVLRHIEVSFQCKILISYSGILICYQES